MIHIYFNPVIEKLRRADMRMKLKQYRFIIMAILLVAGASIAGWAFAFHYDNLAKGADPLKELRNDLQKADSVPSTSDHNRIILLLVFTGLVGFFGVRRQNNTMKTFAKKKLPEIKSRINLLSQDNLENQTCRLGLPGCVAS
jgi:hypothetical protein